MLLLFGVLFAAGLLAFTASIATTKPAEIRDQEALVAQIQSELDRIGVQAEDASEAYNGAMYELSQAKARISSNTRSILRTRKNLAEMQGVLNRRLVQLYTTKDPSVAEILVTSGSITEMADRLDLAQRLGTHDSRIVKTLRADRERLEALRRELMTDRAAAAKHVTRAAQEKARIEGLLREREAVFASANAKLQRLIEEERERQRRAAEEQARRARERAAALAAQQQAQANERPAASQADNGDSDQTGAEPANDDGADAGTSSSDGGGSPEPAPSASSSNAEAASIALQYLGVPYRWGGADPSGFDCSGLASYVYGRVGKSVPHYTVAAYNAFPKVSAGSLQPGDLVFWRGLGHMGIYIGGGQYVHAPQTGDVVKVSSMSDRSDFAGAVRP